MYRIRYFLLLIILSINLQGQKSADTKKEVLPTYKDSISKYRTITNNGVWSWFSDPRAVYYEGEHHRTYVGWVDNFGSIYISYFDHISNEVKSAKLYNKLEIDDHNNPSILIDKNGYILVFFNTHLMDERPLFMTKSKNPEDITSWSEISQLFLNDEDYQSRTESHTYTNVVQLSEEGGRIYIFWRGMDWKPCIAFSDDQGNTWSKGKILFMPTETFDYKKPYTKIYADGKGTIHFAFTNDHPKNDKSTSIYYMNYKEGFFYKADGSKIKSINELPIKEEELDLVYDAKINKGRAWIWDIAQNKKGIPILAYAKYPDSLNHTYSYAIFDKNKWQNYDLINAGGWFPDTPKDKDEPEPYYSGGINIDHESPNTVYISVKRKGVFEIEKWTTNTKGKKWKTETITDHSTYNNIRPFAVRNIQKGKDLQVLWLECKNYIYYNYGSHGNEIELDFEDRYDCNVKMNLISPEYRKNQESGQKNH